MAEPSYKHHCQALNLVLGGQLGAHLGIPIGQFLEHTFYLLWWSSMLFPYGNYKK